MKAWKRTSVRTAVTGLVLIATLTMVIVCTSAESTVTSAQHSERVFKFKTFDAAGMDVSTQMRFQPSAASTMQVSMQSGDRTFRIEFTVKSVFGPDAICHDVQARYIEQIGRSKPEILRKPRIRTLEGIPAYVQLGDFHLEISIEPVP